MFSSSYDRVAWTKVTIEDWRKKQNKYATLSISRNTVGPLANSTLAENSPTTCTARFSSCFFLWRYLSWNSECISVV